VKTQSILFRDNQNQFYKTTLVCICCDCSVVVSSIFYQMRITLFLSQVTKQLWLTTPILVIRFGCPFKTITFCASLQFHILMRKVFIFRLFAEHTRRFSLMLLKQFTGHSLFISLMRSLVSRSHTRIILSPPAEAK